MTMRRALPALAAVLLVMTFLAASAHEGTVAPILPTDLQTFTLDLQNVRDQLLQGVWHLQIPSLPTINLTVGTDQFDDSQVSKNAIDPVTGALSHPNF